MIMQYLLIRNARLPETPANGDVVSVLMAGGSIISIGSDIQHPLTDTIDIDAKGSYVLPTLTSLSNPRPVRIDGEALQDMNFENATAGITAIMTVSPNIEDNIDDFANATVPLLNYAFHIPLHQVNISESRRIRKIKIQHGVSTAIMRFGDEKYDDVRAMAQHITAARILGLRVIYDLRGLITPTVRAIQLRELCRLLREDSNNKAYIIGIEYEEELNIVKSLIGNCGVAAHLSYDPFAKESGLGEKLHAQTIVDTLRENSWCSLGLAYSASKALKERWPDMTPEIVSRNKLPLLNAIDLENRLTVGELSEYAMARPASFVGMSPNLGMVREGSSANLIVWNHNYTDDARFAAPSGDMQDVRFRGRIDYVIMNGKVVVDEKFRPNKVCGRHIYCRIGN